MNNMSVEQLIDEIQVYIDGAKTAGFGGSGMIKINREEILAMFDELKLMLPNEINQSKEIVKNQEARVARAEAEAERIINNAAAEAEQMINEDELVVMANMRAQQIIDEANDDADEIIRNARDSAYEIQSGALAYAQNILSGLEEMYSSMVEQESSFFSAVLDKLKEDYRQVIEDKHDLDSQMNSGMKAIRSREDFERQEEE